MPLARMSSYKAVNRSGRFDITNSFRTNHVFNKDLMLSSICDFWTSSQASSEQLFMTEDCDRQYDEHNEQHQRHDQLHLIATAPPRTPCDHAMPKPLVSVDCGNTLESNLCTFAHLPENHALYTQIKPLRLPGPVFLHVPTTSS